jgi:hypothetical protein
MKSTKGAERREPANMLRWWIWTMYQRWFGMGAWGGGVNEQEQRPSEISETPTLKCGDKIYFTRTEFMGRMTPCYISKVDPKGRIAINTTTMDPLGPDNIIKKHGYPLWMMVKKFRLIEGEFTK